MAKKLQLVEVEWTDAQIGGGWNTRERYADKGIAKCRTAGYLLVRDKRSITIMQNVCDDGTVSDSMTIPAGCVKRVRRLK